MNILKKSQNLFSLDPKIKIYRTSKVSFSRIIGAIYRRLIDIPHSLAWKLPLKFSVKNKEKLLKYKDIHKGKRCFIVANGPSLKKMDLSLLKDEITIGMNRIYLMEKINNFKPTYLVSVDIPCQLGQFTHEYNELTNIKFFNWNSRKLFNKEENLMFLKSNFNPTFERDIVKNTLGSSKSVTYTCLQLAYYMGFTEVILIGKDHNYNTNGISATRLIESTGNESNHFIEGYYKKGMKWGIPNYKREELSYKLAKQAYEKDGRKILDATIDGKLDIFEKVDYYSLFD